jgi:O-antigen/teichoic acid export membrane protein
MPDQPRALRIHLTLASTVVLLVATVAYAVLAALGDAPWNVVPGLLVATAVYGLVAWLRPGRWTHPRPERHRKMWQTG